MNGEATPLRMDAEEAAGARVRIQLDWRTFVYLVAAVVAALAVIAVFSGTATMLTRVGVGLIIALALDPITKAVHRRLGVGRGLAAGIVGVAVLGLAAVFIGVLAPLAVEEAGQFSEQLPATLDELEQLPLVGGLLRDNEIADRAQEWVRDLPEQFTDERIAEEADRLVSGVASVMIVTVVAIALLIDGENLLARLRRLLSPQRRAQADYIGDVVYRTLGRYFGGS
ncbi:MAG TPA: AI-2E family transporter, partial [Ilumatobacteraceae bacterium]|nr:AI-2E family transporter [Ilumatobacteraceae bacterium]